MNNRTTLIILTVIIVATIVYVGYFISALEVGISDLLFPYECKISPQYFNGITNVTNVTKGTTAHLNLTFTSYSKAKIAIPIEEFSLVWYNENVTSILSGQFWNRTVFAKEKVFNYSLSLNKIILEPGMSNSSIISVNFADNAPVGRYTITLQMGECEFLSPSEKEGSYISSRDLCLVVNPKG